MLAPRTVAAYRLAAQHLSPGTQASDPLEAARDACGIQAQDLRSALISFHARLPLLVPNDLVDAPLNRIWTARGTLHLIDAADRDWMYAALVRRHRQAIQRRLEQRGQAAEVHALLDDLLELIAERPLARPELLAALAERGHPELNQPTINQLLPWVASRGLAVGDAEGRWRAAAEPTPLDEDEALGILARRYFKGYGPATDRDLAAWAGLSLGTARRAIDVAGQLDSRDGLTALPGALDSTPPRPARCLLLAGFDPVMLGYASRAPVVAPEHDAEVLPGGGMLRSTVLAGGRAVGTWRLKGGGARRTLECRWFARRPAAAALAEAARGLGVLLGVEIATH